MIPELRRSFNSRFTPERYRDFLEGMRRRCGMETGFRQCETPCFFPKPLLDRMSVYGKELVGQLLSNPAYLASADAAIPAGFRVPGESAHPLFVQADFGLDRNGEPRLVEIQGFPSLYAYQPEMAEQYCESYELDGVAYLIEEAGLDSYRRRLRRAILGDCDPENVILLEIDPSTQKTASDFELTGRMCGIATVNIRDIEKEGRRLYYGRGGLRVPVHRIYNRVIADELARKRIEPAFRFTDDLNVEWAGHPNWFFRLSKFSIPFLRHPCVPRTRLLDPVDALPDDLENYVLKPLFSFAGRGVRVGLTRDVLASIPPDRRSGYILQERVDFASIIETPPGPSKAEVRIVYIWDSEMIAGPPLVRMGRGKMMGVDHNRQPWSGASAGFYPVE